MAVITSTTTPTKHIWPVKEHPFYALSYSLSLDMFEALASGKIKPDQLTPTAFNVTRKIFYSTLLKLKSAGLITKKGGQYRITTLGEIVYDTKKVIDSALNSKYILLALDNIKDNSEINEEERMRLATELVKDPRLMKILFAIQSNQ